MKILIGCPTYERYNYCVDLWVDAVKKIQEFSKEHQVDYLLADNSKTENFTNSLKAKGVNIVKTPYFPDVRERVVFSRNFLRDKAIKEGYDYFFSLEQDVIPEEDILEKFLAHKKNLVCAYYSKPVSVVLRDNETGELKKAVLELALIWLREEKGLRRANPMEVRNKGLMEIGGSGVGCVLISREVFEKIKFRYLKDRGAFDDMLFYKDTEEEGYKLFLDSDIKVKHLNKPWDRETV